MIFNHFDKLEAAEAAYDPDILHMSTCCVAVLSLSLSHEMKQTSKEARIGNSVSIGTYLKMICFLLLAYFPSTQGMEKRHFTLVLSLLSAKPPRED